MRFDVDATFQGCRAQHGLAGFELDATDLEGLWQLVADAETHARTPQEALAVYEWVVNRIALAVELEKRLIDRPALRDVPVTAPVFIIAPARTGSTFLQWLLALHPALRSPALWELWSPLHTDSEARRREARDGCEARLRTMSPAALRLHPMATDAPDECHWIMRHSTVRAGLHLAPGYSNWIWSLDGAGLGSLFRHYRQTVQLLQAADPGRRWLSKAFAHALFWPVLFDVFPDARVVRIHRDPRRSIASSCSLFQHAARGVDPLLMGEGQAWSTIDGLWRMMIADGQGPEGHVTDVLYEELREAPVRVARELAGWLGLPDLDAYEAKVAAYLAGRKRIRAAPHAPDLEEFGLSDRGLMEQFEPYIRWVRNRLDPAFCT